MLIYNMNLSKNKTHIIEKFKNLLISKVELTFNFFIKIEFQKNL
jgi:hypothetical protein